MKKFMLSTVFTFFSLTANASMETNCSATGITPDVEQAVMSAIEAECSLSYRLFPLFLLGSKVCFADGGADYREYTTEVQAKVDPEEGIYDYMQVVISEGPSGRIAPVRVTGSGCSR